jgi:outer membrane biosynthesis protein TonB
MTATHTDYFPRAVVQSTLGHLLIYGIGIVILLASSFFKHVEPAETPIEVAILAGPQSAGEFGRPAADTPHQESPQQIVTPPPPAPVNPEPPIAEPPPIKISEPPKSPDDSKQPDKPVAEPPKPEKPKHVVQVNTNILRVAQNIPAPMPQPPANNNSKRFSPPKNLGKILGQGLETLPVSKNGGAGFGGGAPGSIARGTPGSAMDLYKAALKAKLYNAWQRPAGCDGFMTGVRVSIARDGSIVSSSITRRSGNGPMDESVIQTIHAVHPARLPSGTESPYTIDLDFNSSGVSL